MTRYTLHLFVFFFSIINTVVAQTKYEGFGATTKGGKGKRIVHVKNLNATGPGSLYEAMGSNRTIIFDVGGTISGFRWDSSDGSDMAVSNLTIDGSTAPPPGITLDNNNNGDCLSFQDGCHDIIVQYIRVRNAGNDGLSVVNAHNIVFDHVSSSGNRDGNLDITAGAYNVTVQWSILGPGIQGWSGAMLIAYPGTKNISVHHNLFASYGAGVGERNPLVHNATDYKPNIISYLMADFTNNIVWNWGNSNGGFGYGSGADYGGTLQLRNNFYQSNSQPENAIIKNKASHGGRIFASGNVSGNRGIDPDKVSDVSSPWPVATVVMEDPCSAARKIITGAGPRPLDKIDQSLISMVNLSNCLSTQNQPPFANAGKDIILALPSNTVTITGNGSDPDGKIISFAWTKISGPKTYTIRNTNTKTPTFSNLQKGTYVFRLIVTDKKGSIATDDVTVIVKSAIVPHRK